MLTFVSLYACRFSLEVTTNTDLNDGSDSNERFSSPTETFKISKKSETLLKTWFDFYKCVAFFFDTGPNIDTVITTSPPNSIPSYQLESQNIISVQIQNISGNVQSDRELAVITV